MSKISATLKEKRRVDKLRKETTVAERKQIQEQLEFKSSLQSLVEDVRNLMRQDGVHSVEIRVRDEDIPLFGEALNSFELSAYTVTQRGDELNVFVISELELF